MPYDLDLIQGDAAQVQNSSIGSFGSGRLIATNLVLTAAHALTGRDGALAQGVGRLPVQR
jgi:hypothetical protein